MTFVLALVICLGLAACGGSDYNSDNSSDPSEIEDAAYDAAANETVYDADFCSMGGFKDLAGVWYLDDDPAADSIEIDADGTWILYEYPEDSGGAFHDGLRISGAAPGHRLTILHLLQPV